MANIGDRLTQPESGMQRIDDSNINIKYCGVWELETNTTSGYYNNTATYSYDLSSTCEFYIYSSSIYIVGQVFGNRSNNIEISIDGNVEYYNSYYDIISGIPNYVQYVKTGLDKTIHKVIIKNTVKDKAILIDAIDIDADGYMVYCDDNGKLYYDVTPIMTSDNTPAPYVARATNIHSNVYKAYGAFDGDSLCGGINSVNKGIVFTNHTGSLLLDFSKKQLVNNILLSIDVTNVLEKKSQPTTFKIYGSNDNSIFTEIIDITDNEWDIKNNKNYNFHNAKYRFYKFELLNNNGSDLYTIVGELRYLLAIDTPFYLIQDNVNSKIYNYDEENNQLVEVTDTSILHKDALNNTCIYDLNKVIDLTDENILILSNKNLKLNVEGIKSDKELIISNQNLSTINAEIIHNFVLEINKIANGNIKFVISNDNGVTWQTWNGGNWTSLTNTCSLKKYSLLSDSEKTQWDKLKEEIWLSGISTDTTGIDYNIILTNKTIRFAFVLYRPTCEDNISLTRINWLYDKVGVWHKLSEDDIDIAINTNSCSVTAKLENLTNVKVNILI